MRYVYVDDQNNILKWPVTVSDLKAQPPRLGRKINFSLSRNVTDAGFPHLGIYPVTETDAPVIDVRTQTAVELANPLLVEGVWTVLWYVEQKTAAEVAAFDANIRERIKKEASHRITRLAPEWKQRNATARGLELLRKGEANLTTEEQAEVAAMDALWAGVKRLRTVSDQLEAMDPPPQDFNDDRHWVEAG